MSYIVHKTDIRDPKEDASTRREVFLVTSLNKNQTSKGTDYYDIIVGNMYGKCPVKIWEVRDELKEGDFVQLSMKGQVHSKYGKQWKVEAYLKSDYPGDPDFSKLIYKPDIEDLFSKMTEYPYQNHTVKQFIEKFLSEVDRVEKFKLVPASMSNHHSIEGGLVQHTYEVFAMTECLLETVNAFSCYKSANLDVALCGALLHDISKTDEYYKEDGEWKKTPASILVGNPSGGYAIINRWAYEMKAEGLNLDPHVVELLEHICISHQSRPEWGSPVPPLCSEALAVAAADGLSANISHVNMAEDAYDMPGTMFTKRYGFFHDGRAVYKVPHLDPRYGEKEEKGTDDDGSKPSKKPSSRKQNDSPGGRTRIPSEGNGKDAKKRGLPRE